MERGRGRWCLGPGHGPELRFRDVTFVVKGDGAWSHLKHEGGPHRVQRVPVTESQGRIHTSSATVTVLPEADEVDVQLDPNELQIDVYRSSGPGGQSVNTTDSAVRLTHILPPDLEARKGTAYVICVGVNGFDERTWDLQFAVPDARAMATTLGWR